MNPYDIEFNFRIVFLVISALVLLLELVSYFKPNNPVKNFLAPYTKRATENWKTSLASLTAIYFVLALAAKFSALYANVYSAQDFWLFEDMLHWMTKGHPFITRFADQGAGPVQHGAIHSFLTFSTFTLPLAFITSPTFIATAFNAVVITAAGACLGVLAHQRTKLKSLALILPIAFWFSEWTSRILNYETHPEAAYPLVTFICALPALLNPKNKKMLALSIVAWMALAVTKQDAIAVGGLLWAWLLLSRQITPKKSLIYLAISLVGLATMATVVKAFNNGMGVHSILIGGIDSPVMIPHTGLGALGGHTITGLTSIGEIFEYFAAKNGGVGGLIGNTVHYFFRAPFAPFILIAPWILFSLNFWVLMFPLCILFSFAGGLTGGMEIYCSATLVGLLWVAIASSFEAKPRYAWLTNRRKAVWVLCFAGLYGGTGPKLYHRSPATTQILNAASTILPKLNGIGIVPSSLILVAPRDKVWGGNAVAGAIPEFISWIAFPVNQRSYEESEEAHVKFREWMKTQPEWSLEIQDGLEIYQRTLKAAMASEPVEELALAH